MAWLQWRHAPAVDDELTRRHTVRQQRRRLQVSGLVAMVGALIVLLDAWPAVRQRPLLFFVLVAVILFLALWIVLLAMADWLSARVYHRLSAVQLAAQRQKLEQQLEAIRAAAAEGKPYPPPEWN